MRALPCLILLMAVFPYSDARGDTLRCGSYLIQEGDDVFSLLAKCGEPTQRVTIAEPVYASSADGGHYPTGVISNTELWHYNRGPGSFPVIIRVVDGKVQSLHFVK